MVIYALTAYSIRVWGVVYLCKALREPPKDKRMAPHFLVYPQINPFGAKGRNRPMMSHMPGSLKPMYEQPRLFDFVTEPDLLLCASPENGAIEEVTYETWEWKQ